MKNAICRLTSIVLLVAITLCTMTFAVNAEGSSTTYVLCSHTVSSVIGSETRISGSSFSYHTWTTYNIHNCAACGTTFNTVVSSYQESHSFSGYTVEQGGELGHVCTICGIFRPNGVGK